MFLSLFWEEPLFVTGRGDIIKKLPDLDEFYVVIVNPNFKISAAWAYTEYDKLNKKVIIHLNIL